MLLRINPWTCICVPVCMYFCVCQSLTALQSHTSFMMLPLTDWLRLHAWPLPAHTACTLAGPLHSAKQPCRRSSIPMLLQSHYPVDSACTASLLSLNNPYSYSILAEWEWAGKAANAGSISSAGFDVWGDSIVIDLEEGGGFSMATLIHQRRA